jgi:hypothetical protein
MLGVHSSQSLAYIRQMLAEAEEAFGCIHFYHLLGQVQVSIELPKELYGCLNIFIVGRYAFVIGRPLDVFEYNTATVYVDS